MQGKLMSHLSVNLTTSATSSRPNDSSLALTSLPSNDCSHSIDNYSVNNYSINNCSINDYSESIDNYSIDNASVYTASVYSASVSELYGPSNNLSSHTTSEVTKPIMAIPTTIIPVIDTDVVANSSSDPETSSATRRKNALAQALFVASDSDESLTSLSPLPTTATMPSLPPIDEGRVSISIDFGERRPPKLNPTPLSKLMVMVQELPSLVW